MTATPSAADALLGHRHRTLEAVVCDELRNRIVSGQLPPGLRLVESSLAEDLAVSRAPVREAIRQLEHEGFVTISPRRGAAVAELSVEDAMDCYEIRAALEAVAAKRAAKRRTDDDLALLRQILAIGDEYVTAGRWADLVGCNTDFHGAIADAAGNSELSALLSQYSRRIAWIFSRSATHAGADAWAEHAEMALAIEQRNDALAEKLTLRHLSRSKARFEERLEAGDPPGKSQSGNKGPTKLAAKLRT
jgi:DNA-binding GntR family transcriptional regulator